jgi:hypothetical protein
VTDFPVWANIAAIFVIANVLFHIVYLLDRRTKSEGVLFSQPASPRSRIYAGLLAVILGGAFIIFWTFGFREGEQIAILAIASIALLGYSLGIDRPLQQVQKAYAEIFHNFAKNKKIIGVEGKTIEEVIAMARVGGKFVIFEYCISPLIVTLDYDSNIYFIDINEDTRSLGFRYSMISLLFGWESLFGLIHAIRCIMVNFRGGKDVTHQVIDWLTWLKKVKEEDESSRKIDTN